jgi:hypothetical protein
MVRRKCVSCILIEENNKNGYHKYILDIQEENGEITTNIPAYGVDMQDALKRVLRKETIEKIEKVYDDKISPLILKLLLLFVVIGGVYGVITGNIDIIRKELLIGIGIFVGVGLIEFFRKK